MTAYTVFIPRWHPTPLNRLLGHWSKGAKLKKQDRAVVAAYTNHIPQAQGKRRLGMTIVLKPRQRACDPDSQFKSLCDALVANGMLKDDNRQGVEVMPAKYDRSPDWGTHITLREM